jgi:DNA-binding PadR family transcriptional regulator
MLRNDSRKFLPLTPAVFHTLLALRAGQKHGYAILKWVASQTKGAVRLSSGTLYGVIAKLTMNGLIENSGPVVTEFADERRRYYHLTSFGESVISAECLRLKAMLVLADVR